jgi:hypothetical protein
MKVTICHKEYGEKKTDTVRGASQIKREDDDIIVYWENLPEENRSLYEEATVQQVN